MKKTEKKGIFLVEDHPVFRYGISQLINQQDDMAVCGESDNVRSAAAMIYSGKPDLILLDLSLNGASGLELLKEMTSGQSGIPVLVLSMYEESFYAERVLKLGARGYIMKRETFESVIKAIRLVLDGKVFVSEAVSDKILNRFTGKSDISESPVNRLTTRELEVFQLIGNGFKTSKISQALNLNINTINTYKERIKEKLNLNDYSELIQYSIRWMQNEKKE